MTKTWVNPNKEKIWKNNEKPSNKNVGWLGIRNDIYQSGQEFLPEFVEALRNLPGEAYGAGKNYERIPKNLLIGLGKGGHGLASTPGNIRDYLVQKEIVSQQAPSFRLPESIMSQNPDFARLVGLEGEMPGDALIQGLASAAPYIAGGELGALGRVSRLGARSGTQALHAIGQNEDPIKAALSVPAIELPITGAMAARQLAPTRMFRGNLSPEEIQTNLRATEGTETGLGDIVGSPSLKQLFENMTTKYPLSGADELLARQAQQVENRAQGLLDETGQGLAPGERNAQVKNILEEAFENQRNIKNNLYRPVDELAIQEGFSPIMTSFTERAQEQMQNIADSPFLKYDTKFRNNFEKLAGLSQAAGERPSILDVNVVSNALHDEGTQLLNKATTAHDRALGRLYLDLASRANADLRNSLLEYGSPELQNMFNTATKNYAENFSQFLDNDVYKLTQPAIENETIINDIIKPGKKGDKFSRIEKIQNVLPPEQRNILGNAWLRNAIDKEGTLNPKQFARAINDLGPRQFEALFPDPVFRQQLLDYGRLRGMNEHALSRMANPKTGATLGAPGMLLAQGAAVAGAASHGNLPMAAAYALGPQIGSRYLNHLLTNPATRKNFVEKMLNNQPLPPAKTPDNIMRGLLAANAGKEPFMETENFDVY